MPIQCFIKFEIQRLLSNKKLQKNAYRHFVFEYSTDIRFQEIKFLRLVDKRTPTKNKK